MKRKYALITFLTVWIISHVIYLINDQKEKPVNIGLLHSFNGTLQQSEMPIYLAAKLALDEINLNGGVLGRKVKMVIADGMSDSNAFAVNAQALINGSPLLHHESVPTQQQTYDKVDAIFGTWTSSSRRTVIPIIEKNENLLFYSVQYEGVEGYSDPQKGNVVYMGACANQQLRPAIRWARLHLGKSAYFIGSNYIYPRISYHISEKILTDECRGQISSARFVNLKKDKTSDFKKAIEDIRRTKPDYIINTLNGMKNNTAFFKALSEANFEKPVNVISFSITENDLKKVYKQLPKDFTINNFLCWNYFSDLDTYQNRNFTSKIKNSTYKSINSKDLPDNIRKNLMEYFNSIDLKISEPMIDTYSAIHLWARACEKAQSTDPEKVRKALLGSTYNGPGGITYIDSKNGHSWKTLRIAKVDRQKINIVWSSIGPIKPQPFYGYSQEEWGKILDKLQAEFNGNWESSTLEDVSFFKDVSLLMTK